MFGVDQNQPTFDPSNAVMAPYFGPGGGEMFMNQPTENFSKRPQRQRGPSLLSRIPSLYLPAIILLGFAWLLHAIATFIPYWSVYSNISGSRAGLWSARYFNYQSIQNFYVPQPTDFQSVTDSIRFTSANTKGYMITVQFLMTFNFVFILIVLVLLIADYIFAQQSPDRPHSFLIQDYNSYDIVFKFGLLLYILYVFVIFEFAAWITYVGSRHDNNWTMHISFAFTVIVSVFLVVVFIMYLIEFIKRFQKSRIKWQYWYGQYIEWGFFVYLSALLLLLIVICCPEWAYAKIDSISVFREIGLFKQCYLSVIYKNNPSTGYCTLSDTKTNQAWVNAVQAFMLIAYIINMILLILIVVFRREFRHNEQGYFSDRLPQPAFTYIIAGLILFFGFIFTLIGVSIFGAKVFRYSTITVNWAYIIAVFAMVLFLITAILFILDAVHSQRQMNAAGSSSAGKFFFPAPLNQRVSSMQPLLKPEPAWQPQPIPPWEMAPPSWDVMNPPTNFMNTQFFPPQQMMPMTSNYAMDQYSPAPMTQAIFSDYMRQMQGNPSLMNYSGGDPSSYPDDRNNVDDTKNIGDLVGQHILQQQRLNINHERLLERYQRLQPPRISTFQTFGTSSLPGRNYDRYLDSMSGNSGYGNSLAAISRAGIGSSDDTYRWMGGEDDEPLPNDINSVMRYIRDEPMPFVDAENSEPNQMYEHPISERTPAYILSLFKNKKYSKQNSDYKQIENEEEDNEDISIELPLDVDSLSTAVPREPSAPSNQPYDKLHSQSTITSQPLEPISAESILTENDDNSSDNGLARPKPPAHHSAHSKTDVVETPSLSLTIPLSSEITPLIPLTTTPTTLTLSIQDASLIHSSGLSSASSHTLNSPLSALNDTSDSVMPNETLSNKNDEPSSIVLPPGSTIMLPNHKKVDASTEVPSLPTDDDDDDGRKKYSLQKTN